MLNTHRFLLPAILAFPRLPASRVGRRDRLCSPLHFLFFKKDRGRERGIRSAEIIKKVTLIPPYLQRSAVSASIPFRYSKTNTSLTPQMYHYLENEIKNPQMWGQKVFVSFSIRGLKKSKRQLLL